LPQIIFQMQSMTKATFVSWLGATLTIAASAVARTTEESFIPSYNAASVHYLWGSSADLQNSPGSSLAQQEAGVLAQYPLFRSENSRLTTGVRFRWNGFDFDGASPVGTGMLDLYRLQVPVNYWHSIGEQWKLWAGVEPGLFTDFKAVSGDDFALTALAVAAYEWRPEWSLSLGAYYSRDLGEDQLLPVCGVIWRPNPHWNISATFPRFRVAYAPDVKWNFDLSLRPGGSGWNIRTADGQDRNLEYESWRVALGVERLITTDLFGKLCSFAEIGTGFAQKLKLKDGNTEIADSDLTEMLTLSLGLRLRF
jgi:hypothetical protein